MTAPARTAPRSPKRSSARAAVDAAAQPDDRADRAAEPAAIAAVLSLSPSRIASSVPGRIRVRDPGLRSPERLARLLTALRAVDGVADVDGKATTGSVVVRYDAARIGVDEMEARVEQHVDSELAKPRSKIPPSTRVRINRAAKYGMLGSLAASLALATAGNKRWHAATGMVFVACLGVHLAVHRRHVLR